MKDLTTLTDTELAAWLGEVLQENGWHDFPRVPDHMDAECELCGCYDSDWDSAQPCKKAVRFDPIPLDDANVAMKWRDWFIAKNGSNKYRDAVVAWYISQCPDIEGMDFTVQIRFAFYHLGVSGTPKDILMIVASGVINNA